ncbi:MAG: 50S ribosomal protein L13 [Candidatus Woesearchaeota archaeon]|nr:MAG: 50S ribosomal protein L13 [Candidatus Woesearchaeota archaeon]
MIVIDGKDLIVGRVATFAAKKALLGETIRIINCEQMVITGSKPFLTKESHRRRVQGTWSKGPFYYRMPDRYVRRIIRGMLPYKTARGKQAYSRILCYVGMPDELKNEKNITIESAHISKVPNLKYITVKELSKLMGAKI